MTDRRSRAGWLFPLVSILLVACGGPQPKTSPIDDSAALLTADEEAVLEDWQTALLGQYDIDFRVRTVQSAGDLGRLAAETFAESGVGSRSRTGRGLLLVIDAGGERARLEVARPLEGIFVDSFVAYVEREQMVPFFRDGRVGEGIVAAAELIVGRAEQGLARAEFDERETAATSAGAGAEVDAMLDEGAERPMADRATDTQAAETPADTVVAYLAAMAAHDGEAALDLYTPKSRAMLGNRVVTRAQMDNVVRTYVDCPLPEVLIDDDAAVLQYPADARTCAPWLLRADDEGRWQLDLAAMQRAFRFDTRNHWRVADRAALGAYEFAFAE
jgi:uncharacterized protein